MRKIITWDDIEAINKENEYCTRVKLLGLGTYQFNFEFAGFTHIVEVPIDGIKVEPVILHLDSRALINFGEEVGSDIGNLVIILDNTYLDAYLNEFNSKFTLSGIFVRDMSQLLDYKNYIEFVDIICKHFNLIDKQISLPYLTLNTYINFKKHGIKLSLETIDIMSLEEFETYIHLHNKYGLEAKVVTINDCTDVSTKGALRQHILDWYNIVKASGLEKDNLEFIMKCSNIKPGALLKVYESLDVIKEMEEDMFKYFDMRR
jgi:hypothetical protein